MPSTSMELHISGMNILVVMVRDCLECLELPGVRFSGPKLFEDILEASVLDYCQYFSTDDYKRAGLNRALTMSLLSEDDQGRGEVNTGFIKGKYVKLKICTIAVITVNQVWIIQWKRMIKADYRPLNCPEYNFYFLLSVNSASPFCATVCG